MERRLAINCKSGGVQSSLGMTRLSRPDTSTSGLCQVQAPTAGLGAH